MDKVRVITSEDKRSELKKAIDTIRNDMPQHLEMMRMRGQLIGALYNQLMKEKFSHQDALTILLNTPSPF